MGTIAKLQAEQGAVFFITEHQFNCHTSGYESCASFHIAPTGIIAYNSGFYDFKRHSRIAGNVIKDVAVALIERSGNGPYIFWIHDVDIKLGRSSLLACTSLEQPRQCSWH
jgi:hypothetical protein